MSIQNPPADENVKIVTVFCSTKRTGTGILLRNRYKNVPDTKCRGAGQILFCDEKHSDKTIFPKIF